MTVDFIYVLILLFSKLAEEELQLNVASQDVFAFPSEEEIKKPQDLQDVQQRMKDVITVLNDFKRLHESGRCVLYLNFFVLSAFSSSCY